MPSKLVKRPAKARNRQRKVALLTAHGQTPQQIAPQVGVTERHVQHILSSDETIALVAHLEATMHEGQAKAQELLIQAATARLDGPEWLAAARLIEDRITHGEEYRAKRYGPDKAPPGGGVNLQINNSAVTLDDLLAPHRGMIEAEAE